MIFIRHHNYTVTLKHFTWNTCVLSPLPAILFVQKQSSKTIRHQFTALRQYCSKEKVVSFVTDSGNILLKFRFSSTLEIIFQGLLPELFSIGINLKPFCIDHTYRHYL